MNTVRAVIQNTTTFIAALICLSGGIVWAINSNFDYEPLILIALSLLEIVSFISTRKNAEQNDREGSSEKVTTNSSNNEQKVKVNINMGPPQADKELHRSDNTEDRNAIIESRKPKTTILFIDDDTKFKTVKIFKDSGWKNTKTTKDVKSIDLPIVQNANIIFVDINGVGKLLGLQHEGLDLAQMIKQKYPEKKVIIYSAKKDTNAFHPAWDIIDGRIEKNALPIQFQNVAENYCLSTRK